MNAKKEENRSGNEVQFELKYCERCGGLWLRPTGGGQIYCVGCAREMAQLPPASKEPEMAGMSEGWEVDEERIDEGEDGIDQDAAEGVA